MSQIQLGLLMYIQDFDAAFPLANWTDALEPYVGSLAPFHSPAATGPYGYAYNQAAVGKGEYQFEFLDRELSFFDSTLLAKNAVASATTMPYPPRYGSKNTVGYLNGQTQDEPPPSPSTSVYAKSKQNVKQLTLGMLLYSNDYDDLLPLPNQWTDELFPYVANQSVFHSPAVSTATSANFGYALNSAIAGQNPFNFPNPGSTIGIFDSTDLRRNATDPITTLPNPPRYIPGNTIGYLDGHVGSSRSDQALLRLISAKGGRR